MPCWRRPFTARPRPLPQSDSPGPDFTGFEFISPEWTPTYAGTVSPQPTVSPGPMPEPSLRDLCRNRLSGTYAGTVSPKSGQKHRFGDDFLHLQDLCRNRLSEKPMLEPSLRTGPPKRKKRLGPTYAGTVSLNGHRTYAGTVSPNLPDQKEKKATADICRNAGTVSLNPLFRRRFFHRQKDDFGHFWMCEIACLGERAQASSFSLEPSGSACFFISRSRVRFWV